MAVKIIPFNKSTFAKLSYCGRVETYRDKIRPGLFVDVRESGLFMRIYKKPRGSAKAYRETLGPVGTRPLHKMLDDADDILHRLAKGTNPKTEKKRQTKYRALNEVTLTGALEDYLASAELAHNTVAKYRVVVTKYLKPWLDDPLREITRKRVEDRHKAISRESPTQANAAMRTLRLLVNYHNEMNIDEEGFTPAPNPVAILSTRKPGRNWNQESRRENTIQPDEFRPWFDAISELGGSDIKGEPRLMADYLTVVLLTGLRRREASSIEWSDVSFKTRSFVVQKTKNKKPLSLPLSDFLFDLLQRRFDETVFPGEEPRVFPVSDPKKFILKVRALSGVDFTVHDLRRTFISVAESLDISLLSIKALVNHAIDERDVTGGYARIDTQRLRDPMQRITDHILKHAGIKKGGEVVPLTGVGYGTT